MSLYNALFGVNPLAAIVVEALGATNLIPRFRDAYFDADENRLVIFTRTGGGNRDYYDSRDGEGAEEGYEGPFNDDLRALPTFLYDEDDDFDCTYASFYFSVPEAYKPIFDTLRNLGLDNHEKYSDDPDIIKYRIKMDRFTKMIEDLQNGGDSPDAQRALEVGKTMLEGITKALDRSTK